MNRLDPAFVDRIRSRLADDTGSDPTLPAVPWAARVAAATRAEGAVLGDRPMLELVGLLQSEIAGLGLLEPLVLDSAVTDVLVHGPAQVWIDRGGGLERTAVRFRDEAAVRRLAVRLATSVGRRLDDAAPFVDARLPGGVRVHAVVPPIATGGTCLSLRIPSRVRLTLADWVASGSLHPALADRLISVLQARCSFLVTGGTGTGKTTLLASLVGALPPHERIVVVEDTLELNPDHPQVVRLQARLPNVEGIGAVTVRDLVRHALRMRPDRLLVGEVRGAEVIDLLAALNTGHEGGAGTLHANAAADVPARLEALAGPAGLQRLALHSQLAAGVEVVVHLARWADGQRRVVDIAASVVGPAGLVSIESAWHLTRAGDVEAGPAATALAARLAR